MLGFGLKKDIVWESCLIDGVIREPMNQFPPTQHHLDIFSFGGFTSENIAHVINSFPGSLSIAKRGIRSEGSGFKSPRVYKGPCLHGGPAFRRDSQFDREVEEQTSVELEVVGSLPD